MKVEEEMGMGKEDRAKEWMDEDGWEEKKEKVLTNQFDKEKRDDHREREREKWLQSVVMLRMVQCIGQWPIVLN